MKKVNLIIVICLASLNLFAQDTLSLENAINIALEKNFDMRLTENRIRVAENNKSLANSAYLPMLNATASSSFANSNSFIVAQNEMESEVLGAESASYGASLALNYNLFNGFGRKNKYQKMKTLYALADVQKKELINSLILKVSTLYYSIARLSLSQKIIADAFNISKQRLQKVQYQYDYSQSTKLDVLNAQVDANNDSLKLVNIHVQLGTAMRNLNFLLGQEIEKEFEVEKEVELNTLIDYEKIQQTMDSNNFQLQQLALNKTISDYDIKISKASLMPNLNTFVSYSFNNGLYDDKGMYAQQNRNGLNLGLSLNWNIFDGGMTKVRVQNAKIDNENQDIYKEQLQHNLRNQLANVWANYSNQLLIIKFEKKNVEVNNENFKKTKEYFKLGQISSILFRQAQLNFINSEVNLMNAKFEAKIAELQLKKLQGKLIVE